MPYSDPEKRKQKDREWHRRMREFPEFRARKIAGSTEWARRNRAKMTAASARWRQRNLEKVRAAQTAQYRKNPRRYLDAALKWRRDNPDQIAASRRKSWLKRKANPSMRIESSLRGRIYKAVKKPGKLASFQELCGCSREFLRGRLESFFRPGMTWDNYGPIWHVDHIRPCSSFDLTHLSQQRECFHYSNLQPLFAVDNLRKGKSMPKENTTSAGPDTSKAGADQGPITSPFNYTVDEEAEREKALQRATDKVPNAPFRPIL